MTFGPVDITIGYLWSCGPRCWLPLVLWTSSSVTIGPVDLAVGYHWSCGARHRLPFVLWTSLLVTFGPVDLAAGDGEARHLQLPFSVRLHGELLRVLKSRHNVSPLTLNATGNGLMHNQAFIPRKA